MPNTPQAAALTATNRDSFPSHGDGKAHQGDTITYSVAVTNTGDANATSVNYSNTVDQNNSTLVGGSPAIQFTVAGDTYSAIGNVKLDTATITPGSGQTVLENDAVGGAALTAFGSTLANANGTVPNGSNTVTTSNGGTVTMNADGSFKYNPGAGFSGADSFWYTLTKNTIGTGNPSGFPAGAARVTISVSTPIWFVDQAAAGGGDGRLATPFNCLGGAGCFNAVNDGVGSHPAAGDFIFLYKSSGAPASFTGGVSLLNNQKLIGEGASQSLDVIAGVSVPPGSNPLPATGHVPPVLTTTSFTDNIRLGTGNSNTVRGLIVGDSGGANGDASDISGSNIGTLTVSEVTLNGTGRALNLTGGGTIAPGSSIDALTVTQSTGGGVNLDTVGGSLTVAGTTSIDNQTAGQSSIRINSCSGNFTFGTTNLDRRGSAGILINAASGTIQFGAVTINNQNLSGTSAIAIDNTTGTGSITLASASVNNNSAASAAGIALSGNSGTISINGGAVSNTVTTGIQVSSAGNANVTVAASVTNSAGRSVQVLNRNGGTTTLSGNISDTGTGINVANNTAGTINFSGATKTVNTGTNQAVTLNTNAGATINFSNGGLAITTTSGTGFNASGGGTISVTTGANNNSISSGSGGAIIANGVALNATFASVSATGGTNGVSLTTVTGTSNFGTGSLTGATGAEFLVSSGSPTITYSGSITQNTASQKAVDLSGITGGTIILAGAIGSNGGSGVSLAGTGGTVTISGDMTLNNSNSVFSATGSGLTVNATGANNTIGATNAATTTAVTITNATIGSSGVTFKSISQTGGSKAITINNAGTLGAFTVTGTGTTAGSGGTIQNTTGRSAEFITFNKASGSSVVLSNMTFNNNVTTNTSPTLSSGTCGSHAGGGDASTCGAVIFFNSVTGISMTNTTIDGTTNSSLANGIVGNNVINMTLTQVTVKKAGNELGEDALKLVGIAGTLNLDRVTLTNNASNGVYAEPFTNTMNMTVSGGTFGINTAPNGQQGILVVYRGTGGTVTVQKDVSNVGTVFQNIANHAISVQNVGSPTPSTVNFNIDSATFTSCNAAIDMPNGSSAPYNFNVTNNNLTNIFALASTMNAFNTGGAVLTGTFNNNTIGQAGVAGSGCNSAGCDGIRLTEQTLPANGSGTMNITVTNNSINRVQEAGIISFAGAGSGKMKLTITGNTITNSDNLGGSALQAIHLESGTLATDSNQVCVTITNNSMSGANWLAGIRLTERSTGGTAVIHVPGMGAATPLAYLGCGAGSPPCTSASTNNSYAAGMAATVSTSGSVDGNNCPFLLLAPGGVQSAPGPLSVLSIFDVAQFSAPDHRKSDLSFNEFSFATNASAYDRSNPAQPELASSNVATFLNQQELDMMVSAAINRWQATDLTALQIAKLRGIRFEIAQLQGANLGEADGNRILVDRSANGKGWFVDPNPLSNASFACPASITRLYSDPWSTSAGHVDLLTVIEHEMGHRLGLDDSYLDSDRDSIMYGYLTVGERRLPASGQAKFAQANNMKGVHFLRIADSYYAAEAKVIRKGKQSMRPGNQEKTLSPQSGGTVNLSLGTITPGSTVVITYQVTVNNAAPAGASSISNQGTTTAAGGINVLTDDPDLGGASDPTITPLLHPTAANGVISGRITDTSGNPVEGAVVTLNGGQSRKTITDADGKYQFDNVETGGFYTVTPARVNFNFNPFNRSFSQSGNNTEAAFTGTSTGDNANPLDTSEYFVRQQYVDILGREPDEGGLNFWSDQISVCGDDTECLSAKRVKVAAAFFIAQEFQQSGSFLYDVYAGALGRKPVYSEYSVDRQQIVGGDRLEAEKVVWAQSFVQRTEFVTRYQNAADAETFVNALLLSVQVAGVDLSSERAGLVGIYNGGTNLIEARAAVVRTMADHAVFKQAQYNSAFVVTEYFNYLRRDPENDGYQFWLNVVNNGGDYRGLVCSFITAAEYQRRFSGVVSRSNGECGQ